MKGLAAFICLMAGGVLCFAPPLYGPYPSTSSGSATNVFLGGAVPNLVTTNGSGNWTITGNALTATWATNLNRPYGVSEILVSSPTNNSVESHADFTYDQTANFSTLSLGATWDLGNTSVRGGLLELRDAAGDVNVSIGTTNGTVSFLNGFTLHDTIQHYSMVNGVSLPFYKGENHNGNENVAYFFGTDWDAVAFQVGHSERAQATNGMRFSFLLGETGHSYNVIQFTNNLALSRQTVGTSGPNQKSWFSYNSANETYEFGTNVRSAILSGTNVTVSGQTNISLAGGTGVVRLNNSGLSIGQSGTGGVLNFWDELGGQNHVMDVQDGTFTFSGAADFTAFDGSEITQGTIAPARLGSGSGGSTKFLREDSTWQTISGGSVTYIDTSTFPTSTIPIGSASLTNFAMIAYKGFPRIVATNRAVGGWMESTNALWWPFTP